MTAQNDYKLIHILIFVISLFTILFLALIRTYFVYFLQLLWRFGKWITIDIVIKYIIKFFEIIWDKVLSPIWKWIKGAAISTWDFIEYIASEIIIGIKKLVGLSKKGYNKAKVLGEAAYIETKKLSVILYNLGKDLVIEGINAIDALWNFIYKNAISIWNSISSAFQTALSIFDPIKNFLTDSLQIFLNLN